MPKKIVRGSLRKHLLTFLLAVSPLGRSPRETFPGAKSEEKRMLGETLGWVVYAFCCRIILRSRSSKDPLRRLTARVVYPFRIVKINLNIFNKHKSVRVHACRRTLDRLWLLKDF